jgi:hypothetical protein
VDGAGEDKKRPYRRLSKEVRAHFLEVLRETGNRRLAAEAIGMDPRSMDQRRQYDPALDREWEEAAEEAHHRLSGADGPFDLPPGSGSQVVRRGKKGRWQIVAPRKDHWNAEIEERFRQRLRETGNVRAAALSVGFCESAIWQRKRRWPAFARMLEEVLDEAEMALEFRIACMGSNVVTEEDAEGACGAPTPSPLPEREGGSQAAAFDPDFAMRFLKWREEKRRGRGRWAPRAKLPSIEEVTEKIVRRVEAIERHRQREEGDGHA